MITKCGRIMKRRSESNMAELKFDLKSFRASSCRFYDRLCFVVHELFLHFPSNLCQTWKNKSQKSGGRLKMINVFAAGLLIQNELTYVNSVRTEFHRMSLQNASNLSLLPSKWTVLIG